MRNTFTKSIYERRFSLLIWFLSIAAFTLLTVLLFPSFRESIGESLQEVPEGMEGLLGSEDAFKTLIGFVDIQVIAQMVFLTLIMAIIAGIGLLAGKESNGTLQSLLAQPISRTKVYVQSFAALAVLVATGCLGIFAGVILGVQLISDSLPLDNLAYATGMVWLITMFFGSLAFSLGAIFGKRGTAGVVTGFLAFLSYMLTGLSGLAEALKKLDYASPFHYFNNPSVLKNGLDISNILVLSSCILIFFIVGLIIFRRRDIP